MLLEDKTGNSPSNRRVETIFVSARIISIFAYFIAILNATDAEPYWSIVAGWTLFFGSLYGIETIIMYSYGLDKVTRRKEELEFKETQRKAEEKRRAKRKALTKINFSIKNFHIFAGLLLLIIVPLILVYFEIWPGAWSIWIIGAMVCTLVVIFLVIRKISEWLLKLLGGKKKKD